MAKVTADNLGAEIQKILDKYADDISDNMKNVTRDIAKKGVQALKNESKATFGTVPEQKKKYASSWKVQYEEDVLYYVATIYNGKPGLPHLLEHGHALRGGGRSGHVAGREHIAGVEENLKREFEAAVERAIKQ